MCSFILSVRDGIQNQRLAEEPASIHLVNLGLRNSCEVDWTVCDEADFTSAVIDLQHVERKKISGRMPCGEWKHFLIDLKRIKSQEGLRFISTCLGVGMTNDRLELPPRMKTVQR